MTIGDNNFTSTVSRGFRTPTDDWSADRLADGFPPTDTVRLKITREFAAVLAGIVYRLRKPLLTVALLPVPVALLLFGFAIYLGGLLGLVVGAMSIFPLALTGWLIWQRQQMLLATNPMEDLADDVGRLFDLTSAWSNAEQSLSMLSSLSRDGWGPFRILRGVWTTVQFGSGVFSRSAALPPRVVPFTPRRLQATASVAAVCMIAVVVVTIVDLVIAVGIAVLP